MKSKILIVISVASLLFPSCSKNEAPAPDADSKDEPKESEGEVYFTIKTSCNSDTTTVGNWIIIHRENGELEDFKPYDPGDTLVFEAPENEQPNTFSFSTLVVSEYMGDISHNLNSTTEITKGTILDLSCSTQEETLSNPSMGDFDLTVNNVPFQPISFSFNVSNGFGVSHSDFSTENQNGFTSFTKQLSIQEKGNKYLISVFDGNNNFKYYSLENFQNKEDISIDYGQFNPFDSYLELDIPDNEKFLFLVRGYEDDQKTNYILSHILTPWIFSNQLDFVRVGYLDRFEINSTFMFVKLNQEFEYMYSKFGTRPDAIVIPKQPSITIENESIHNFKFSSDITDYEEKTSIWVHESDGMDERFSTTWGVKSSQTYSPKIGNLPEELIQKYPKIHIQDLNYIKTDFRLNEEERITLYKPN